MMRDSFASSYKTLNKAQKEAVDAIEGPVIVIAGPGTGKTTILTLRIANILKQTDTSPDSILALTFTESGASAMRKKLAQLIGAPAYRVAIHTFHGFAGMIIEKFPDNFPRIIGSEIITEAEQVKIIEEIVMSQDIEILRPYGNFRYYVRHILREIQMLKRENVTPETLLKSIELNGLAVDPEEPESKREMSAKRDKKNRELASCYQKYEKRLASLKRYDFDDMLLELIRALESDHELKLTLQEQYQYILADEHQDANASQNKILELLSDFHEDPNLFIVGDDKQAIYRFQGASLENFLYFRHKYKGAKLINLTHNYRSHQGILDASHSIIVENPTIPGHEHTKLISLKVGGAPIRCIEFQCGDDEFYGVAQMIHRLIGDGMDPNEIAILYRDNKHADTISKALSSCGINVIVDSDDDLLYQIDVMKLLIIARSITSLSDGEWLAQSLLIPEFGGFPAEVSKIAIESKRSGKSLYELLSRSKDKNMRGAYQMLKKWASLVDVMSAETILIQIAKEIHLFDSIMESSDSASRFFCLQKFFDHIRDTSRGHQMFSLRNLLDHIETVKENGLRISVPKAVNNNGVRLMTAHRSKGLEFERVFIIRAIDGVWGNRRVRKSFDLPIIEHSVDSGRIEDERRLFYVALTRAKNDVVITYSSSYDSKEGVRTQFIEEIDPALITHDRVGHSDPSIDIRKSIQGGLKENNIGILDKAMIREKFLGQPLSVTHLNNYLSCPWKYIFVNLLRIPEAQNKHQMYGTAIHHALKIFFDSYAKGKKMSKQAVTEAFTNKLKSLPLQRGDLRESLIKGKKALQGYIDEYMGTWKKDILTEQSIRGESIELDQIKIDGHSAILELTGKLDKIEFISKDEAIVTDFKTGKPKSKNEIEGKTKDSAGDYKRQLVFYKLLLGGPGKQKIRRGRWNMAYGEIDFIEPNDRGIYKKERFEIGDDEVLALVSKIKEVSSQIYNLTFEGSTCDDEECEYCRLAKVITGGK